MVNMGFPFHHPYTNGQTYKYHTHVSPHAHADAAQLIQHRSQWLPLEPGGLDTHRARVKTTKTTFKLSRSGVAMYTT